MDGAVDHHPTISRGGSLCTSLTILSVSGQARCRLKWGLLTLLHSLFKPCSWQQDFVIGATCNWAFKCMLECYLAPILLAEQSTNDRALLLSCGMAGNVIGDGEEDKRVQLNMKA